MIKIDVWSDVVCPFCYLGKKKLEVALQKLKLDSKSTIEWHSFQLDPTFPKNTSSPASEHLIHRKGLTLSQIQSSHKRLTELGHQYQIDFQFDKAINFNTFDAHRLLHWSKEYQKQNELKNAFLEDHFSEGIDLSKRISLLKVIRKVGLNISTATEILDSELYAQEFQNDINLAKRIGITGVPFFVFNQKLAISGAQSDNVFEDALAEAASSIVES